MSLTDYPPKPRMIAPFVNAAVALLYVAVSALYFAIDKPAFGTIWAAGALVFVRCAFFAVETHRIRMETWRIRCRTADRFRDVDRRWAEFERLARLQADDSEAAR